MKPYYLNLLFIFTILFSCFALIFAKSIVKVDPSKLRGFNPDAGSLQPFQSITGRTLKNAILEDTFFVAHQDGSLYNVDSHSGDVRWVFSSGEPIWSSFQAFLNSSRLDGETDSRWNDTYMDIEDGSTFVLKGPEGEVIHKFTDTAEQFLTRVSSSPNIFPDQIIVGSKITKVFIVNAKSGRLVSVHTFAAGMKEEGNANHGSLVESNVAETGEQICVVRTTYSFQSTSGSGEPKWDLHYSEYSVSEHSQGFDDVISQNSLTTRDWLSLESKRNTFVPVLTSSTVSLSHDVGDVKEQGPQAEQKSTPVRELALPGPNPDVKVPEYENPLYGNWWLTTMLGSIGVVVILSLHRLSATRFLRLVKLTTQSKDSKVAVSKKKRSRKLGNNKNSSNVGKIKNVMSQEGEHANELQLDKNDIELANGGVIGRKIGRLFVSNIEIARGSNGTIVLEGNYEGRPVAIKRLVKAHHDVASKEIQNLIASDRHQNIVRWYGVEYDSDFVYLSLERCMCNLNDLVQVCSASSLSSLTIKDQTENPTDEYNVRLDALEAINKDIELWKTNGYPSAELLKMMRDVVSGLAHLHDLGIIHRDLKPQNVLILKQRSLRAKLSDMGISKRLNGDMSSLGHHATGSGSSGWQAPEQLLHGRQTRAVDLFSLGCVLFFCITGGKHPFGDRLERDINIVRNRVDLFMVEHIPEAVDLLSRLLDSDPEVRPKALDVLNHPFFWISETRLAFLRDTSDRVELEDREVDSDLLKALEAVAPVALGGKWDEKMEPEFISNIGRYRRYKYDSTRDLLRVIRNKLNHFRELPQDIQELLGPVPEGFDGYFATRFPKFLMEVYKVMYKYCREEECFRKYFKSNLV
ncbi:hypothetical protein C5167_050553 [Papaver somniferum]|uniref:non-specific serine/threonine protein kinase n=1 Tax=Papaver somniferum TaxID=3469 RepID=A0A4Y7KQH3_PAPSO|nr:serine/threonine-protein kinase/endoribonuclease IRE1a-like [Papaver somniferum]RZC75077.1 hypothetical protein C5167_050553 [Papaver somniferum]